MFGTEQGTRENIVLLAETAPPSSPISLKRKRSVDSGREEGGEEEGAREEKHPRQTEEGARQNPSAPPLSVCQSCEREEPRYRCPRCHFKSCSLACCKAHKEKLSCSGRRDRTKYKSLQEFTDADLHSDYFFLEEVSRSADGAKREMTRKLGRGGHRGGGKGRRDLQGNFLVQKEERESRNLPAQNLSSYPPHLRTLVREAKRRGIHLYLMPTGMSKRKSNSSQYNNRQKEILWRIEWSFPLSSPTVQIFEERVSEKIPLEDLIAKYLGLSKDGETEKNQERTLWRARLGLAYAVDPPSLVFLFQKEFVPGQERQFYRLNGKQDLASNLCRKAVIEFPTILVVRETDLCNYKIAPDIIEEVSSIDVEREITEPQTAARQEEEKDVDEPSAGPLRLEDAEEEEEEDEPMDITDVAAAIENAMRVDGLIS